MYYKFKLFFIKIFLRKFKYYTEYYTECERLIN